MPTRRDFIHYMAASSAVFTFPQLALAKLNSDQRFVFIIQRGAADGLNTVIPYADPDYAKLRKSLAIDVSEATKLDGMFALHPALKETANMYRSGQAMFVHAVASPYRSRSHFDGQNVLETGGTSAYQLKDGWLNRLLGLLSSKQQQAIAISQSVPMALRGSTNVASYAPSKLPQASDDLMLRVSSLYENDETLHAAWSAAMEIEKTAASTSNRKDPAALGKLAGDFLAREDGHKIAMLETTGWDTHNSQIGRLNRQLGSLDKLLASLKNSLGDVWQNTTVIVCTEFGRTAAANGTQGTDHGTGSAAMVLGGTLNGGRVLTDWPGLSNSSLYQGRDLKPTLALDELITSVLAESYTLDPVKLAQVLFPSMTMMKPLTGFY